MPRPRLPPPPSHRRPLSTLRLSQTTRTHLTNASFVAAAAFAILTVSLGMSHLPCPARSPDEGGHKTLGMQGERERWSSEEKGKGKNRHRWLQDPVAPGAPKRALAPAVATQATEGRRVTLNESATKAEGERRDASRVGGSEGTAADGSEQEQEGWRGWARKVTIGT